MSENHITVTVVGDKALLAKMASIKMFFQSPELKTVLEETKNRMLRLIWDLAPRKSRFLVGSRSGQVEGFGTSNVAVRAGVGAYYAPYVEYPTKPHPIIPRSRKSLFWTLYNNSQNSVKFVGRSSTTGIDRSKAGATFTFSRGVRHPGTQAQPFMKPMYEQVKPRMLQAISRILKAKLAEGTR
jgi:hypothetical protein